MQFIWDEAKNKINRRKHGVSFELAREIFDDPCSLSWLDKRFEEYQEERWISIGCAYNTVIILVVHTFRRDEHD